MATTRSQRTPMLQDRFPDFILGIRGGDWWAFTNSKRASTALRAKKVRLAAGELSPLIHECVANGLTWATEETLRAERKARG